MTEYKLLHIHIGKNLPEYIYDSIYQTLLINNNSCKIYVLIDDTLIEEFKNKISNFNLETYTKTNFYFENLLVIIPLSIITEYLQKYNDNFKLYDKIVKNKFSNIVQFREEFWVSTTARFFYIEAFMKMFNIQDLFHIENDIMIYKKIQYIYDYILNKIVNENNESKKISKICMVQDSPNRVIPSILFFPNHNSINNLNSYITKMLEQSNFFINDMNLLGMYPEKYTLPCSPENDQDLIFDGAAIGQYLGGIDSDDKSKSTKGFINETSVFKPNICNYMKNNVIHENLRPTIKVYTCNLKNKKKIYPIVNLHIHSKQLYQFSSILDITFNDIITGDRILKLCDFTITTKQIYDFHKNIEKYTNDTIIIKDFSSVNISLFNTYITDKANSKNSKIINLFIYTHILDDFIEYILPKLETTLKYNIYTHNSDHEFNDNHARILLKNDNINHVFAQNINTSNTHNKLTLLPLGIANSMWPHGNLDVFYKQIIDSYKYKKTKSIYVNINPNTFGYRQFILDQIKKAGTLEISKSTNYENYIKELSKYRFCLCLRGNGIDTHRFWESLYLGVIPVIINNKYTECKTFVEYLKNQQIPFLEIKADDISFEKYNNNYFDEYLYRSKINENYIDNLKLTNYK